MSITRTVAAHIAARELLYCAEAYFYEGDEPASVYMDTERAVLHAHPILANTQGEFPAVYRDPSAPAPRLVLKRPDGTTIMEVADASDFFDVGKIPKWHL